MTKAGDEARGGGGHVPYVCIYASQVAMCIGANKHKKISEAMDIMWQRVSPASFGAALKRNGIKTDDQQAEDIIAAHAKVRDLVRLTLTTTCESSDQVAQNYVAVAKELGTVPLAEEDRRLVNDVLKRNLYTTYGNMHEHRVLTYVRDRLGIKCREDPTFYKAPQGECTGPWGSFTWYVGGKIDAIDEDRTLLIEIKNRVNRLFYRIPFYESVQVQAYLHLLDLERGVLVECLKSRAGGGHEGNDKSQRGDAGGQHPGSTSQPNTNTTTPTTTSTTHDPESPDDDVHVNVIPLQRDRDLWAREIVPKLEGFVDFLARLLHDPAHQDRYLQSKRRSAMVTSHINNWLKFRRNW